MFLGALTALSCARKIVTQGISAFLSFSLIFAEKYMYVSGNVD